MIVGILWFLAMRMRGSDQSKTRIVEDDSHVTNEGHENAEDMSEDNNQLQQPPVVLHVHRHPAPPSPIVKERHQDFNFNCPTTATTTDEPQDKHQSIINSSLGLSNVDTSNDDDGDGGNLIGTTSTSSSDYQWFLDYGFNNMDNSTRQQHQQMQQRRHQQQQRRPASIFAAAITTYEDLARNIDANLAEIDMEDFRSEDINSILALPAMYCGDFEENNGERAASPLSGSMVARVDDHFVTDPSSTSSIVTSRHSDTSSGGDTSSSSTDMSVCKSGELLFSPIKENQSLYATAAAAAAAAGADLPAFSVDSLDCDSYDERELMLTCQANMNNYTIAFEGSYMKSYSDDSDYHEADNAGSHMTDSGGADSWSGGQFRLRSSDSVDGSLVQSDCGYTTWSKLRRRGGNDVGIDGAEQTTFFHRDDYVDGESSLADAGGTACKSNSLPNLFGKTSSFGCSGLRISQLNVSTDSDTQCVPVYDVQQSSQTSSAAVSRSRIMSECSSSSQQSVSLMRLFIQQKAASNGSSAAPSVTHSLSSGTLATVAAYSEPDQIGTPQSETTNNGSLDERLQIFLAGRLDISQGSDNFDTDKMSDPATAVVGSAVQLLQHTKSADATMNALKRRMKSTTCKLYGGEALHEDAITPPLASPIEEEDEEDRSQWSNYLDDDGKAKSVDITNDPDVNEESLEIDVLPVGNGSNFKTKSETSASKPDDGQSGHVPADTGGCSSSSSGYVSGRGSVERRRPSSSSSKQQTSLKTGKLQLIGKNSGTQIPVPVRDEGIQTSFRAGLERILTENAARVTFTDKVAQIGGDTRPIYVCRHPKNALPDLGFLRRKPMIDTFASIVPQDELIESGTNCPSTRLRGVDVSHVQDWDSLKVLLPNEFRERLANANRNVSQNPEPELPRPRPPPLPKRSVSLPHGDNGHQDDVTSSKPSLPKGILRRPTTVDGRKINVAKRYSMPEFPAATQTEVMPRDPSNNSNSEHVPLSLTDCPRDGESHMLFHDVQRSSTDDEHHHHHCCGCQLVQFELKAKKMVSFSSNVNVTTPKSGNPLLCCHNMSGDIEKQDVEKEWPSSFTGSSEIPPQLFCVSPLQENTDSNMKISLNFQRHKGLVLAVTGAIGVISVHFNHARDHHEKFILGNSIQTPSVVCKLLDHLCPTLYGILNDGLKPEVYNMFGHMDNSVWLVVEAFAQSGNCNKPMSDLVIHVNNDESLWEKKMKFNAFLFGLLNMRSLDTWFAALGASNKVLQKHYLPEAFLRSTPMTSSKSLFNDFLVSLQRLSMLPFELDLCLENRRNWKNLQFHSSHPSPIGHRLVCLNAPPPTVILSKSSPEMFHMANVPPDEYSTLAGFGYGLESCWRNHRQNVVATTTAVDDSDIHSEVKRDVSGLRGLRRGYSQDSAIATGSSGYSNNTATSSSYGDLDSSPQILCHRCSVGGWMTTDFTARSIENRKREDTKDGGHKATIVLQIPEVSSNEAAVKADGRQPITSSVEFVATGGGGPQRSRAQLEPRPTATSDMQKDSQNNNINVAKLDEDDGVKFKELRLKWENMSSPTTPETPKKVIGGSGPVNLRSRIPRLVTKRI